MKEYDLAFSLGSSCGVSQALRAAGLQFASYPLDWLGSRDVRRVAKVVAGNFEKWFEKEDFQLVDVWHSTGFDTRAYLNTRTDFGFSHEFPDFVPFDESFPKIRETYERRVERFIDCAEASRRMLVVFMELPVTPRTPVEALAEVRQTLMERFPKAEIDLLYVGVEPGKKVPELAEVAPGVMTADYDYRKIEGGETLHYVEWGPLAAFLKANFQVPDPRTEEEKRKYSRFEKVSDDMRWGPDKSRFRRWLNKHMYKTYRSVEQMLIKRGLVQKEGPFWFWEDMRSGSEVAK